MAGVKKEIEEQIAGLEKGTMFSINDFCAFISYGTAKKSLLRLENQGRIKHVIDGYIPDLQGSSFSLPSRI